MEIKFRGISQSTGKFVYGWFKMCGYGYCIHNKTESHYIFKDTLGQFTGRKSKGKDVYKGDVYLLDSRRIKEYICVVWDNEMSCYAFESCKTGKSYGTFAEWVIENMEIIGNIYQNSEMVRRVKLNG